MCAGKRDWTWIATATLLLVSSSCVSGRVRVTYQDDESARAAVLASEIAPVLGDLERDLKLALRRLSNNDPSLSAYLAVLNRAKEHISQALSAPDLAAARDYVLQDLDAVTPVAFEHSNRRVQLAEFRPENSQAEGTARGPVDQGPSGRLLERLAIFRSKAEANDLFISICAATSPKGAGTFRIWPQSYPGGARETLTPGTLRVYRGLYAYRVLERGNRRKIECDQSADPRCPRLDLMTDSRPGLRADFTRGSLLRTRERPKGCSE